MVIRDFDVTHPDFENYQEEAHYSLYSNKKDAAPDSWLPGYVNNSEWLSRRNDYLTMGCGNTESPEAGIAISNNGYPHDTIIALGFTSTTPDYIQTVINPTGYEWYGEYSECMPDPVLNPLGLPVMRGNAAELCTDLADTWTADQEKECNKVCKKYNWSQIVYITPGMVSQTLKFNIVDNQLDMMNPVITKNRSACDNAYFEQWFTDVPGINQRNNTMLLLDQDLTKPTEYSIRKDWNNGGFFPLDSISQNSITWIGNNSETPSQFDPQTLSICEITASPLWVMHPSSTRKAPVKNSNSMAMTICGSLSTESWQWTLAVYISQQAALLTWIS